MALKPLVNFNTAMLPSGRSCSDTKLAMGQFARVAPSGTGGVSHEGPWLSSGGGKTLGGILVRPWPQIRILRRGLGVNVAKIFDGVATVICLVVELV